ncbi:helix-turn-helix domain-containing protein [Aestuariibaculum sediminum]|uniref:Helix-turn-helix domain-containing protein n=1 Tax=Aestuariibaculum sediminum TaxID=2770637 RepID=A0A8J6QAE3_9FLAO|nr:helix-turn-helix domain-containing protein [Aestuariibaculum sediminum]MBD0831816.1 helix-turn-helix domain-containing protein [Aestuariibaculum sediminum]
MTNQIYLMTEENIEMLAESIFNKLQASSKIPLNDSEDELLTIEEAAKLIKLTKPTIYGLVHRKEIPFIKKGKRLYFEKSELLDWIRSGRRSSKADLHSKVNDYLRENPFV